MSDTATTRLPAGLPKGLIDAIRAFLGDRITTNASLREHHSHGQDTQPPVMPDAVAFVVIRSPRKARMVSIKPVGSLVVAVSDICGSCRIIRPVWRYRAGLTRALSFRRRLGAAAS